MPSAGAASETPNNGGAATANCGRRTSTAARHSSSSRRLCGVLFGEAEAKEAGEAEAFGLRTTTLLSAAPLIRSSIANSVRVTA